MKTVAIFGSTGSIGKTVLRVIKRHKSYFKVIFLFADKNYKEMNIQSQNFKPKFLTLNTKAFLNKLKTKAKILNSVDEFLKKKQKIDFVISAISGYSALDINFKLLKISKHLLIANKETIICGNHFFLNQAKKNKCKILPIDSEHYCVNYFLDHFYKKKNIRSIYLTASGGPFLKQKPKNNVSLKKVLQHPNWRMGNKISINSANMTNKIIELFEAHILFKIPVNKLKIKIEKKSKIHSIVSLNNGLDFFISHKTSMEVPIENSLFNNNFFSNSRSNIASLPQVNFTLTDLNHKTFPIIKTGYKVLKLGTRAMIIFTVLNDMLVEKFLKKKILFNDIIKILIKIFKNNEIVNYSKKGIRNLQDIKGTIDFTKKIKI